MATRSPFRPRRFALSVAAGIVERCGCRRNPPTYTVVVVRLMNPNPFNQAAERDPRRHLVPGPALNPKNGVLVYYSSVAHPNRNILVTD
jgi:hypothetical protein